MKSRDKREWLFWTASALAIGFGIWLRFVDLGSKPLHYDEALHAYFGFRLANTGQYEYYPILHGPLLFYEIAGVFRLFGASDATSRYAPALAGSLMLFAPLLLRRRWGSVASICCLFLMSASPMLAYVSRFARHDITSLAMTLILVLSTMEFYTTRKTAYVYSAVLAVAVSFVNHELTYITVLIWLISLSVTTSLSKGGWNRLRATMLEFERPLKGALALFLVIALLFYSSFGREPTGVLRAFPSWATPSSSIGYWITQHGVHRGGQPVYYYFLVLALYEIIPLVLGLTSAAVGLFSQDRRWKFLSLFTLLTICAYSVAGEKMPWLSVHPLMLLILSTVYPIPRILSLPNRRPFLIAGAALIVPVFGFTLFNAARLSLVNAANPVEMAVYVQTQPAVRSVAQAIESQRPERVFVDPDLQVSWEWYLRNVQQQKQLARILNGSEKSALIVTPTFATELLPPIRTAKRLPLRAWWLPSNGWPGIRALFRYYIYRETWNPLGSTDFLYIPPDAPELRHAPPVVKSPHRLTERS